MEIKIAYFSRKDAGDDIDRSIVKINNAGSDTPETYIATLQIFLRLYLRHAKEERTAPFRNRAAQLYRLVLAITNRRATFPPGKGVSQDNFLREYQRKEK